MRAVVVMPRRVPWTNVTGFRLPWRCRAHGRFSRQDTLTKLHQHLSRARDTSEDLCLQGPGFGYNGQVAVQITIDRKVLADFCRRHHVRRLALFGSVLRDDFAAGSDVDVLVEFDPGHVPGLAFFDMERELTDLLGRKVDLNTPGFLSRYFRDQVLAEAVNQYVAA
jgi:uncharacterized protein